MRLMLHTLKKDARRWWPVAVTTWILLGALADQDRWRADRMASSLEGWLNLLLPLAWACLVAMVVLEEPLVGDRNFWTTRPHRWSALLGAKLAFVLLAIHVPSLLADGFVLATHGFAPATYAGELLWKQVLLFGAVTLPALAIATLVRNFAHFVIAVFAIAAVMVVLNGGMQRFPEFGLSDELRHAVVRLVIAGAAIAVIAIQYARRRVTSARFIAVAGAIAAVTISTWLPVQAEYAFGGASTPPRITLREAVPNEALLRSLGRGAQRTVVIPIAIERAPGGEKLAVSMVEVEITSAGGKRFRSVRPSPNRPFEKVPIMAFLYPGRSPEWLVLRFSGPAWESVKNGPVRIRGSAAIQFYRLGETTAIPASGSGTVAGVGYCTSRPVGDQLYEDLLKVLCESPRELPAASVVLRHAASGREWSERLNSSMTFSPGPHDTWLSPLQRGQTFFRVTNTTPGSQWEMPRDYVAGARVAITPEVVTGHGLTNFEFNGVTLTVR